MLARRIRFGGRWVRNLALAGCCGILSTPHPAEGGASALLPPDRSAEVVEGEQRSRILVPPGIDVRDYDNEGYSLRRIARRPDGALEVEVRVFAAPRSGGGAAADPLPIRAESASMQRLVGALTERLHDPEARARRLTAWVARNIEYRLDRSRSQSADAVLERRDAYCTGSSRLLVALLNAAGLEAREVPGFAVEGTSNSSPGFHRWVEYRPPNGSWRFVDPLSTFGYVPATFVRLAGEEVTTASADASWKLLDLVDRLSPFANDPGFPSGMRSVGTDRTQARGARVRVVAVENATTDEEFRVVLRGPWIRERVLRGGETAVFTDVSAGAYEMVIEKSDLQRGEAGSAVRVFERSLIVEPQEAAAGRILEVNWSPTATVEAAGNRLERPR